LQPYPLPCQPVGDAASLLAVGGEVAEVERRRGGSRLRSGDLGGQFGEQLVAAPSMVVSRTRSAISGSAMRVSAPTTCQV